MRTEIVPGIIRDRLGRAVAALGLVVSLACCTTGSTHRGSKPAQAAKSGDTRGERKALGTWDADCPAFKKYLPQSDAFVAARATISTPEGTVPVVSPAADVKALAPLDEFLAKPRPALSSAGVATADVVTDSISEYVSIVRGLADAVNRRDRAAFLDFAHRLQWVQERLSLLDAGFFESCQAHAFIRTAGHMDPSLIQKTMRENYGIFRRCYEAGLARNPTLSGKVTVRFVIDAEGSVRNVELAPGASKTLVAPETVPFYRALGWEPPAPVPEQTTLPDESVVQCAVDGYRTLKFPPPQDGIVTVVYPIMFSPG